ncbi:FxsB family cyclophane-forming radical SAM/SPASM peptide maturase [Actinomadura montaniterrae]|uniref:FxsB family cyclophane-forming radical SAM/SPASM peptide maturase n=1 Tax=Actinomadura montaniterrae TaxID=1803903 RepID=UPI001CEF941E|nr:FxsB family cyclophane-forming radical SAM/SPASM peptide maturase [Actinomadura montaniterrae]
MVSSDEPGSRGSEWPATLDVGALLAAGWRPTPFRQFILKVHSRCNLKCTYCYMYEMADQNWMKQPRRMAKPTIDKVAERIAEHARTHALPAIDVILHGGEPLLAGIEHLRYAVGALRSAVDPPTRITFHVQTNGVLLDANFLDLFDELDVLLGISLDGYQESHDLRRTRADGRGSYQAVAAALDRLNAPRYRHLFSGLLATVDPGADPLRTYEALLAFEPPSIDFLLPHGNWDAPPPGLPAPGRTPYADWLIAIFDRWYRAPVQRTRIRMFLEIMRMLGGRPSRSEALGLSPVAVTVIETDGSIELVDTLKSAYDGASGTRLHVFRDDFDSALMLPPFAARQIGVAALSPQCRRCEVHQVCGGGLYPHRYRAGRGFRNPSVFCADLLRLIDHIQRVMAEDLADLTGVRG